MSVEAGLRAQPRQRERPYASLIARLAAGAAALERAALTPWFWGLIALAWALVTWILGLHAVDVARMNDLGLISVLPLPVYASLTVLIVCYGLALRPRRPNERLLLGLTALAIVMLYGMTAMVEDVPRFATAWKHVGFIELITRTGRVAPHLEARFNWPGFFILSGFVTEIAGLQNALPFLAWAPVFFGLLYLGPLLMIFRAFSDDRRVVWLSVWLFYLNNWIAQDYFSPQAFGFFLYLTVVAILLRWFKTVHVPPATGPQAGRLRGLLRSLLAPREAPSAPSGEAQRTGLHLIVVLLLAVMAASHQLTPFVTLSALVLLVVFRRCPLRSLPLLSAVLTASWIIFMAMAYLSGNLAGMLREVGRVGEVLDANLTGHMAGSPLHIVVVNLRVVMTGLIWVLALAGAVRRLRHGHWELTGALLAVAPIPLLALQAYGGEMLLRVQFFALPFVALFAAMLFYPAPEAGRGVRTTVALCLASALLFAGLIVCRFGNERAEHMTASDLEAVEYLYDHAPRYSAFVSISPNLPWQYHDWEAYSYCRVAGGRMPKSVDEVVAYVAAEAECGPTYLILTRSQRDEMLQMGYPSESWAALEQAIATSPALSRVFANDTATIWVLAGTQEVAES